MYLYIHVWSQFYVSIWYEVFHSSTGWQNIHTRVTCMHISDIASSLKPTPPGSVLGSQPCHLRTRSGSAPLAQQRQGRKPTEEGTTLNCVSQSPFTFLAVICMTAPWLSLPHGWSKMTKCIYNNVDRRTVTVPQTSNRWSYGYRYVLYMLHAIWEFAQCADYVAQSRSLHAVCMPTECLCNLQVVLHKLHGNETTIVLF